MIAFDYKSDIQGKSLEQMKLIKPACISWDKQAFYKTKGGQKRGQS